MVERSTSKKSSAQMPATNYLTGHVLVAMPGMPDPRFAKSVIYMCDHSAKGAMGFVLNKPEAGLDFKELLDHVGLAEITMQRAIPIHIGGPVDAGRGFVLHSNDYGSDETVKVDSICAVTASIDILRDIASGAGPNKCILVLGYSGWAPGQLESELQDNGWLHAPADEELLFGADSAQKWHHALKKLGISASHLSATGGRA